MTKTNSNKKEKPLLMLFVGDTTNYHSFQAAKEQGVYASIGISKESGDVPKTVTFELVSKGDPRWKPEAEKLLKGMKSGSIGHTRLTALVMND